jgi:hypothetical protein
MIDDLLEMSDLLGQWNTLFHTHQLSSRGHFLKKTRD